LSTVCPVSGAIRLASWLRRPGDGDLSDTPAIGRGGRLGLLSCGNAWQFSYQGIKFGSVASSITGKASTAMIEALTDGGASRAGAGGPGDRPDAGRGEAGRSTGGAGRWFTHHHGLLCRLHRDRIAVFDDAVDDLDKRIAGKAARWQRETDLLKTLPGFGDVVAQAWLGEIGPAPHLHFATHEKLASWVTLYPENIISARKRKHGRTGDAGTSIKPMLLQAAWAAVRARGRLPARYSRLVRRFGGDKNPAAKKAITAIAHTLLKIAYQVLKTGTPYQEPGTDFYTPREWPEAGLAGTPDAEALPGLRYHHRHRPAGGRLTIGRLTTRPRPAQHGAAVSPASRPSSRTSQRHCPALAIAKVRVRRAPTGDPVIVSVRIA
jgi:hypothetical protein